jgi:hypothetical protein
LLDLMQQWVCSGVFASAAHVLRACLTDFVCVALIPGGGSRDVDAGRS